ncbi:MAG: protein-methionine-sulfoxide reductase catalytic subunit MsrP [Planctomycetota bacterium]|nr:protein-methionine-sulfoxide reductase catalytic subunit MsrP [Planctomycetota bacterium]
MPHIRIHPSWSMPESEATPEAVYWNRRAFLAAAAGTLLAPSIGCAEGPVFEKGKGPLQHAAKYPTAVKRNPKYKLDRDVTKDEIAASFNNYYEFTTDKTAVWPLAQKLTVEPWTVELAGCKKAGKHDLKKLLKALPQEERLYRFRCVETWAMAVPWIGVPMRDFVKWAEPHGKAKYVRFVTAYRPKEMPGVVDGGFAGAFPYYEGLRLDEANNELTLLATGMYGRKMPKQNGAPIRLITPWKYGFKSCKSIVRIEFVEKQPKTFWNALQGNEYGFYANVNPEVPHPRWSQANEWLIPSRSVTRKTQLFNGYGEQVAALYKGLDLKRHF